MGYREFFSFFETLGQEEYDEFDLDITGYPLIFLGVQAIILPIVVLIVDYLGNLPSYQQVISRHGDVNCQVVGKDEDVLAEEARVMDGAAESDNIVVKNIKKIYG